MIYDHKEFKERLQQVCADLSELIAKKNLAYGNSYEVVPALMKILYPTGVKPEQMDDMLLLVRLLDKVKRIVENNDPMGEDPWLDITGYGVLKLTTRPKAGADFSVTDSIVSKPKSEIALRCLMCWVYDNRAVPATTVCSDAGPSSPHGLTVEGDGPFYRCGKHRAFCCKPLKEQAG